MLEKLEKFFVKVLEAEERAGGARETDKTRREVDGVADNFTEGDEFPERRCHTGKTGKKRSVCNTRRKKAGVIDKAVEKVGAVHKAVEKVGAVTDGAVEKVGAVHKAVEK